MSAVAWADGLPEKPHGTPPMAITPPATIAFPRRPVRRAIILAHFDPQGCIDPHVAHALAAYRPLAERIVVVSNSARSLPAALRPVVDTFVPRANVGYDFGAWREGLALLNRGDHDEVLCVNDSVYGPLFDLRPALTHLRVADADLWGMVLSDQNTSRAAPRIPHLQSWFLGLRRPVLESDACAEFWREAGLGMTKREIVEQLEIGFSARMAAAGFRIAGLYDATTAGRVAIREIWPHLSPRNPGRSWRLLRKSRRTPHNPAELVCWRLWDAGVPYLKVGLFRVNHYGLDVARVCAELRHRTDYPPALIHGHLARCG
jgi:lipopolysaccharide biosynthesis protein